MSKKQNLEKIENRTTNNKNQTGVIEVPTLKYWAQHRPPVN